MGRGEWTALGKAKVESSGLTVKQATALGMYEVPSARQLHSSFDARAALVLPYYTVEQKPVRAGKGEFYRIRYLEDDHSFKAAAEEKEVRYVQPPHTGVSAYFPTSRDWTKVLTDARQPLLITEGELKAAAGCDNDYATIGLGGVWSFRRSNDGIFFLPELAKFEYGGREVFITFDSDYKDKPQVVGAINALTKELEERGALVYFVVLPDKDEGGKMGLDDYFLEHDSTEFDKLLAASTPLGMCKQLWRMNDEVLYVRDPGLIITQQGGQKMAPAMFKEHSDWATASTPRREVTIEGDVRVKKVPAAPEWIKWPMRRAVQRITYAPGQGVITDTNEYNGWPGWGVKPAKGSVKPWEELTKFIFKGMEPGALEWFYDWCAYPIQNPGCKMFTAVVIHGRVQGTGKTLLGYTLGEIYGKNYAEIKNDSLETTHWAENKQFILGDEITGSDNRAYADTLKRLITQRTVEINIKFVPQYSVPDRINYLFTSQHADSFFLEDTDRRFFIAEVLSDEPMPEKFFDAYDDWLWRGNGPAFLMQWLMDRNINPKFNPNAPAMRTKAKDRMILQGKGDLTMWINDVKARPDDYLHLGQLYYVRDMLTARELLSIYEQSHPNSKVTVQGMNKALAAAGCSQVADGTPLRNGEGGTGRYHAVRNIPHWLKCKNRGTMEKNIAQPPRRVAK